MTKELNIFFYSVDGMGHINACLGVAQELASRGHQITFLTKKAFQNNFTKLGFKEIYLEDDEIVANEDNEESKIEKEDPVKFMAQGMLKTGVLSGMTPLQKTLSMSTSSKELMTIMFQKFLKEQPFIDEAIKEHKPDVIILDHFYVPACVYYSGIPWVSLFSASPLVLYDSDQLPPFRSGCSINEPETWKEFNEATDDTFQKEFRKYQEDAFKLLGYEVVECKELFLRSKYLNLYGYPKELDFDDVVPQPEKHFRIDAFIRNEPEPFELPPEFKKKLKPDDKLIYVSMGSMGSIDVNLQKKMVNALKDTPHKYIFSKGPRHDEFELADNMYGERYLPQTNVLPLVDLVITHGGNNTITEAFSFGKPMIVMPLFGDQYDNAQRIVDKNYGARLEPYLCKTEELIETIDRLLNDDDLKQRLEKVKHRMRNSKSKEEACKLIENLVE